MSGGIFSLAGLADRFARVAAHFDIGMHGALERSAQMVEDEAKAQLGTYQPGWPSLQPATIARKQNGDTPLLETGEMRDSITHEVRFLNARVYSDDPKVGYHELGTASIPPRPFMQPAAIRREADVAAALGRQAVSLLGGDGQSVTIAPGRR